MARINSRRRMDKVVAVMQMTQESHKTIRLRIHVIRSVRTTKVMDLVKLAETVGIKTSRMETAMLATLTVERS